MKSKLMLFLLLPLVCAAFARSRPPSDPRLKDVHSIFIAGNNQAAQSARQEMRKDADKGKGCFALASNPNDADAVLAMDSDSARNSGLLDTRDFIVSGTLTLKSGDLIWSNSERFSDAPFMSGGKVAGKLLYLELRLASPVGWKTAFTSSMPSSKPGSNLRAEPSLRAAFPKGEAAARLKVAAG
jgi:hypothetical protein